MFLDETNVWIYFCFLCFSLRLGIKEDEDDMRLEEEEMKRKQAMKAKRKKTWSRLIDWLAEVKSFA